MANGSKIRRTRIIRTKRLVTDYLTLPTCPIPLFRFSRDFAHLRQLFGRRLILGLPAELVCLLPGRLMIILMRRVPALQQGPRLNQPPTSLMPCPQLSLPHPVSRGFYLPRLHPAPLLPFGFCLRSGLVGWPYLYNTQNTSVG